MSVPHGISFYTRATLIVGFLPQPQWQGACQWWSCLIRSERRNHILLQLHLLRLTMQIASLSWSTLFMKWRTEPLLCKSSCASDLIITSLTLFLFCSVLFRYICALAGWLYPAWHSCRCRHWCVNGLWSSRPVQTQQRLLLSVKVRLMSLNLSPCCSHQSY